MDKVNYDVKDAYFYEELITKLNEEYEILHKNLGNLSSDELISREKELDEKLEKARRMYNETLEREAEQNVFNKSFKR